MLALKISGIYNVIIVNLQNFAFVWKYPQQDTWLTVENKITNNKLIPWTYEDKLYNPDYIQ